MVAIETASTDFRHDIPDDLRTALAADPSLEAKWDDLTDLARNEWIPGTPGSLACKKIYWTASDVPVAGRAVPIDASRHANGSGTDLLNPNRR